METLTADDVVIVDEDVMASIDVMGFRGIQRCFMVPAADRVTMIALVNAFAGISSRA